MTTYHDKVRALTAQSSEALSGEERAFYNLGHHAAQHAAGEIATAADKRIAELEAQLGESRVEKSELRVRIAELLCVVAQFGNEKNWMEKEHLAHAYWVGKVHPLKVARSAIRHDADCNEYGAPAGDTPTAIANNAARAIVSSIEEKTGAGLDLNLCVAIVQIVGAAIEGGKR